MIRIHMDYKESNHYIHLEPAHIRKIFKSIVTFEGRAVKREYDKLQSSFSSKNKVKIYRKTGSGTSPANGKPGTIYCAVGSNKVRGSVLIWLEDGTKVRYRNMSPDWTSRTAPNTLHVRTINNGRALGFDPLGNPGIAARNFRDSIIRERYPEFIERARDQFDDMLHGHGWI